MSIDKQKLRRKVICITIVLILIVAILTVYFVLIKPPSAEKVFIDSINNIVELKAYSEGIGESFGTAVLIDKEGTLFSNAHVVTYTQLGQVKAFDYFSIRFSNEEKYIDVKLAKYDNDKDFAVLEVVDHSNLSIIPIKLGDSSKLKAGEKVYAIGNSSNYGIGITEGIISVPLVNIVYDNIKRGVIQCDLTITSGNSGGALLDKKGKLVGITTFRTKDLYGNVIYGLAYSIPINMVMEFIKK